MATHWEQFKGGPTKTPAEVVNISINSKNVMTFNRRALKLLNDAEAVLLLFDKKESVIGVIPSTHKNADAFPLHPKNTCNWIINAAPFCRHFGIALDRTERFESPDFDNEGILRLDLKRTHNVSVRRRRSAAG